MVVTGHGGGVKGTDILCAAVSAVAQTALRGLLHFGRDSVVWEMRDAFLRVRLATGVAEDTRRLLDAVLTAALLGLRDISREHPEGVTLRVTECAG